MPHSALKQLRDYNILIVRRREPRDCDGIIETQELAAALKEYVLTETWFPAQICR